MGSGAFVIACVASAIGSLVLMFPIAALAVRGHRKVKLPWGKGFALLGLAVVLTAAVNLVAYTVEPGLLYGTAPSGLSLSLSFLVPLAISVGTLLLFWKPAAGPAIPQTAVEPAERAPRVEPAALVAPAERVLQFDVGNEVERLFDDASLATGSQPKAVILMGGVASGKTTLRAQRYASGYVLIDAAEMFHHMSQGDESLDFPGPLEQPLELIGSMVASRAIAERRNIVTEVIGADKAATMELIEALRSSDYSVEVAAVTCDYEESIRRNEERGDSVSAYYAEPFQRRWIIAACKES